MTIYVSLHPRADVDRLYVTREERGRGLANTQDSVNMKEQNLSGCIDIIEEELLKATKKEIVLIDWNGETDTQHKHRLRQDHKDKCVTKPLYEQFDCETNATSC